ncbi:uncharacterized protein LOC121262046 [Juglans microcarpa x Juglans regia]|uniref:uncharacterized protein LOC121262046 n=1 Tax=Juglans microcarpa x Juglans regia TaxID=2249226 RepID=UPI001B7E687A|nr:uncharacterized protein LOC121262046 [Juglans microcarpa x Juglans regia]
MGSPSTRSSRRCQKGGQSNHKDEEISNIVAAITISRGEALGEKHSRGSTHGMDSDDAWDPFSHCVALLRHFSPYCRMMSSPPIQTHKNSLTVVKPESLPNSQSNAQGGEEGDPDVQDAQVQDLRVPEHWLVPLKGHGGYPHLCRTLSALKYGRSTPLLSVKYSDLLVETDSLLFVNWFRNSSQSTWMYFELFNDVLDIASYLPFDISHTYREEISLADSSANLGAAGHDNSFPSVLHLDFSLLLQLHS